MEFYGIAVLGQLLLKSLLDASTHYIQKMLLKSDKGDLKTNFIWEHLHKNFWVTFAGIAFP